MEERQGYSGSVEHAEFRPKEGGGVMVQARTFTFENGFLVSVGPAREVRFASE